MSDYSMELFNKIAQPSPDKPHFHTYLDTFVPTFRGGKVDIGVLGWKSSSYRTSFPSLFIHGLPECQNHRKLNVLFI